MAKQGSMVSLSGKKRVAVVGGGATGCAFAWTLSKEETKDLLDLTILHDEDEVGGHSKTINVWFDSAGKGYAVEAGHPAPAGTPTYPVDIGVQFVAPTIYPNLYKQLKLPELQHVELTLHPELKLSGAFTPDLNWGNFPAYQTGPRFEGCFNDEAKKLAAQFQRDVKFGPLTPLDGITFSTDLDTYLSVKGVQYTTNFFRYLLIPYLTIINGYGTSDLLSTNIEDLYPIFVKIPLLQEHGPYGNFLEPGMGWDRFTHGATSWCVAMAEYGKSRGVKVLTGKTVLAVYPNLEATEVTVEWANTSDVQLSYTDPTHTFSKHVEVFDEVILTTDMTTNRKLLGNDKNLIYSVQKDYITEEKFTLIPGLCYIHQDDECLAPHLRDKLEDGQFVSAYAWGKETPGHNDYGLPYDLATSFQTYLMKNILKTPHDCYVSMYESGVGAKHPDPSKVLYTKTWSHGRWVASFFDKAKKDLHRIQGLGHIWFAGNNTTVDSEEGALVSAMIVADELFPEWVYPFDLTSEAYLFYKYFQSTMFPAPSLPWTLGRIAKDAEEKVEKALGT